MVFEAKEWSDCLKDLKFYMVPVRCLNIRLLIATLKGSGKLTMEKLVIEYNRKAIHLIEDRENTCQYLGHQRIKRFDVAQNEKSA